MGLSRALGRTLASVLVALLLLATAPGELRAQGDDGAGWRVRTVRVRADLTAEDGAALVRVRYVLTRADADPPDAPIEFSLLGFEGTDVDEVFVSGHEAPVVLWPASGSRRSATVRPVNPPSADGEIPVEVEYRVGGAVRGGGAAVTVRVPILTGPPPVAASPGAFQADLLVPEGWAVSEAFPAGLRSGPEGSYVAVLQVTPSMVGFHARTDGAWRPGFPLFVDLLTLLVLVIFGGFGWQHLRRAAA